jgi:hypothetical protein
MSARSEAARFILAESAALGIRVGTDGCDLIIAPPRHMPRDSYFSFQRAILEHHDEVIEILLQEELNG